MTTLKTAVDIASDLEVTTVTVKKRLEGLSPVMTVQNGRVGLYELSAVQDHLRTQNRALLAFLGHSLAPSQSYDSVVQVDEVSE